MSEKLSSRGRAPAPGDIWKRPGHPEGRHVLVISISDTWARVRTCSPKGELPKGSRVSGVRLARLGDEFVFHANRDNEELLRHAKRHEFEVKIMPIAIRGGKVTLKLEGNFPEEIEVEVGATHIVRVIIPCSSR